MRTGYPQCEKCQAIYPCSDCACEDCEKQVSECNEKCEM